MKPYEAAAVGLAGIGVAIVAVGGAAAAFANATPQTRDAVHGAGLFSMLLGAGIFLLGRRRYARAPGRDDSLPSGLQETAKNLAIVGATVLVGSLAAALALARALAPDELMYWILLGLGLLGVVALGLGAAVYGFTLLVGESAPREGSNNP
jgi:hypothetical protein